MELDYLSVATIFTTRKWCPWFSTAKELTLNTGSPLPKGSEISQDNAGKENMCFNLSALRNSPAYSGLAVKCRKHSVLLSPTADLSEGGSGTLVRYGTICGILTNTHVMSDSIDTRLIYSPLEKTKDPTFFWNVPVELLQTIYLETPQGVDALKGTVWNSNCLDICLLQMSQAAFDIALQKSGKEAVDLSVYKKKYLSNRDAYLASDHISHWSWAIDGAPREQCAHDTNQVLHSRFDGLYVCGGSKHGTYKTDPLMLVHPPFDRDADRLQHDLGPTLDIIPDKFGGISGAGVWQISFHGEHNTPQGIAEMFFSGVCVAGIPGQCLYSRGPSALYDIFTEYLDKLLASTNAP